MSAGSSSPARAMSLAMPTRALCPLKAPDPPAARAATAIRLSADEQQGALPLLVCLRHPDEEPTGTIRLRCDMAPPHVRRLAAPEHAVPHQPNQRDVDETTPPGRLV